MNKDTALNDLMKFLSIEGITGQEKNIALAVKQSLIDVNVPEGSIFFDDVNKKIPLPTQTGNLIVNLPGTIPGNRRLFMTHLDTVPLCKGAKPKIVGSRIVSNGKTALGGDNRTGVACLVTMIKTLFTKKLPYLPMTILFTVREESGLWGARYVEKKDLGHPTYGFNCDGASPYEIVVGAVGADRWEVEIIGKASHAGVEPEKGVSSTMVAALALADIKNNGWFGKINKNNQTGTSNIGFFGDAEGRCAGLSTNQVTDFVKIKGESRSHNEEFFSRITNAYQQAFENAAKSITSNEGSEAKIKFKSRIDYYPFYMDQNSEVIQISEKVSDIAGLKGKLTSCNGGLDANWLVRKDIPTITFGGGHYKPHSLDEYVEINEYYDACKYAISLATYNT